MEKEKTNRKAKLPIIPLYISKEAMNKIEILKTWGVISTKSDFFKKAIMAYIDKQKMIKEESNKLEEYFNEYLDLRRRVKLGIK